MSPSLAGAVRLSECLPSLASLHVVPSLAHGVRLFHLSPNLAGDVPLSGCFSNVAVACDLVLVLVLIVLAPQCCFSRLLGSILKNQEGPSSY